MNTHYLPSGANFIIDPDKEAKPHEARHYKKLFCLALNTTDLSTDKQWTADAVRKLATGLVHVGADGKTRTTKVELIKRLTEYIKEEREAVLVNLDTETLNAKTTLDACGYSPVELSKLLKLYTGEDLVNAIVGSILRKGYTNSTVSKTVIPDVMKVLNVEYEGEDKGAVAKGIYDRVRATTKAVNKETDHGVKVKCNDRKGTNYQALFDGCDRIFKNLETASWKELSIAICFATGRRQSEVHGIKTQFTFMDSKHVLFKGQLKTKGRGEVSPYLIPTLYEASAVVRAWERLRELGKASYTPDEVHNKLCKALSTELPLHLKKLKKDANIEAYKDLRDTYAAKVAENKPATMSQHAFLSMVMGHGEEDLETASTYDKRYIA